MAEVAGAIIGGIGICSQLFRLGREVRKAVKTIRNSRRDIEKLARETFMFAALYQRFSITCDESGINSSDAVAIAELNTWAQTSVDGLKELMHKVKPLLPDEKSSHTIERVLIARLEWLFSTSTIKALRASLSVARESINGFGTLMLVNKLNTEIALLKDALKNQETRRELETQYGIPLEEKIGELEQDRENLRIAHRENSKTLKEAIEKVRVYQDKRQTAGNVPAPEQILRFTTALESHAEEILPPRRSKRQTGISTSVSTASTERRTVPLVPRRAPVVPYTPSTPVVATYYSSSRAISKTPSLDSTKTPSSISGGPVSENTATPGPSQKSVSAAQKVDTAIERLGMSPREYINDPHGTILSPPIIKSDPEDRPRTKTAQVGRHTISLSARTFQVNANKLKVTSYLAADAFFQYIRSHEGELGKLDRQLSRGCQDMLIYDIPLWQISIGGIRIHGHRLS